MAGTTVHGHPRCFGNPCDLSVKPLVSDVKVFVPLIIAKVASAYLLRPVLSKPIGDFPEKALSPQLPWMEEPGGLQSMGSLRVGHD